MRSSKPTAKALPKRLCIGIGGPFGPSYSVTLEKGGRLTYTYWSGDRSSSREPEFLGVREPEVQREEIQPTKEQWQAFRKALDELNVWGWQAHYPNPGVCDGTGWSAKIVYPDKQIKSGGSNCFPDHKGAPLSIMARSNDVTFEKFCQAVAVLVGREFK
jgi:hypothetical protein